MKEKNSEFPMLGDTIVEHNGVDIYYTFKDNDDVNNSPSEYWFSLNAGNADEEFDIRGLKNYKESLYAKDILIEAINLGYL